MDEQVQKPVKPVNKYYIFMFVVLVIIIAISVYLEGFNGLNGHKITNSTITTTMLQTTVSNKSMYAYLVYAGSNNFSIINTSTNKVIKNISLEGYASSWAMAITPDGSYAYVTHAWDNYISVINISTDNVSTIPVSAGAGHIVITPDSKYVYVTSYASNTVLVINTTTNNITDIINLNSNPVDLAITPNGRYLYVTNDFNDSISVVNTSTNRVTETIIEDNNSAPYNPYHLAITPDGKYAYVAYWNYVVLFGGSSSNMASLINITTNKFIKNITLTDTPWWSRASDIAITPDGRYVYITQYALDGSSTDVSVIDTSTKKALGVIEVGYSPESIAITPDSKYAYVANGGSDSVSVIDIATNKVVDTIPVGYQPIAIAIVPSS